jgi:hypothetical protein
VVERDRADHQPENSGLMLVDQPAGELSSDGSGEAVPGKGFARARVSADRIVDVGPECVRIRQPSKRLPVR